MLGIKRKPLSHRLLRDVEALERSTQRYFGVSAIMFRSIKFVFYITTLLFSGYLIEVAGVEPFLSMLFAALVITGPEGLEVWLVQRGVIEDEDP